MSAELQPSTSAGRLFYALGRNDVAEATRWQLAFQQDSSDLPEVELMSEFAITELVAAGPGKFRPPDLARIYRTLKESRPTP